MTKRVEALLREIMENGLVFDVHTDTNDKGGARSGNTAVPLGTGSSPTRRFARASAQRATEQALATSAPMTYAIRLSLAYWIWESQSNRSTTSPAISLWR